MSKKPGAQGNEKGSLLKTLPCHSASLTKTNADAQKAESLIRRDFTANAPNRKRLTDITQIPRRDGKLYIEPVLDCYNGEIVALAMDDDMKKELSVRRPNPPANPGPPAA